MLSEEEKKAIQMLDKFITEHKLFNIKQSDGLKESIRIILNLIEELQKEADNYIPKEKIREKINELVENGHWDFLEERDLEKAIDILKELLGAE